VSGTEAIFRELMAGLSEEERQQLPAHLRGGSHFPLAEQPDPWQQFVNTFDVRWLPHELAARLIIQFAAWLEAEGDDRGKFVRTHLELARRGWEVAGPGQEIELVFLRDVVTWPREEGALHVFADWLEEHDDPRASTLRLIAELRSLARSLDPWWVEDFCFRPSPGGYGLFTNSGRGVLQRSSNEAGRFNHRLISTQHALLALLRESFGFASTSLTALGLHRREAAREVERLTPTSPDGPVREGYASDSARYGAAVQFAREEAAVFKQDRVGPEHLVLGICRAAPCVATRVLVNLGASPALVCERVLTRMGQDPWPWLRAHPEVW